MAWALGRRSDSTSRWRRGCRQRPLSCGAVVASAAAAVVGINVTGAACWNFATARSWQAALFRAPRSSREPLRGVPRAALSDEAEEDDFFVPPSAPVAITPIGPFCPIRSGASSLHTVTGRNMGELADETPVFATEMARIQLEAQMGKEPDREQVRKLAGKMDDAFEKWKLMMAKLQNSDDFQSREYYKLTEVHLARSGQSVEKVGVMVKYQVECMKAFAANLPPPRPPAGLDLEALGRNGKPPSLSTPVIQAEPFKMEDMLGNRVVQEEYDALIRDHGSLINLGEQYGSFDPLGKAAFLDQVASIESRWDVFFGRFSLMGLLNPQYKEESEAYLEAMGLGAGEFRKILKECHETMRRDAEAERNLNP